MYKFLSAWLKLFKPFSFRLPVVQRDHFVVCLCRPPNRAPSCPGLISTMSTGPWWAGRSSCWPTCRTRRRRRRRGRDSNASRRRWRGRGREGRRRSCVASRRIRTGVCKWEGFEVGGMGHGEHSKYLYIKRYLVCFTFVNATKILQWSTFIHFFSKW